MPKLKTHKGVAQRFKLTGTGKVMQVKRAKNHFRIRRSKRNLYKMSKMFVMSDAVGDHVKKALPYGLPD
jgi:large subunit ribosomal protein L35